MSDTCILTNSLNVKVNEIICDSIGDFIDGESIPTVYDNLNDSLDELQDETNCTLKDIQNSYF